MIETSQIMQQKPSQIHHFKYFIAQNLLLFIYLPSTGIHFLPVNVISEVEVVFSVGIGHQSTRSHVSCSKYLKKNIKYSYKQLKKKIVVISNMLTTFVFVRICIKYLYRISYKYKHKIKIRMTNKKQSFLT